MRCPDCAKMVSYGEPEIDADDLAIDDGTVSGVVTITLPCAECGTPLKTASLDVSHDIDHDCNEAGEHECSECSGSGNIDCAECDGDGWVYEQCDNCDGTGKVTQDCEECDAGRDRFGGTCEACAGDGKVQDTCEDCDGAGRVTAGCSYCDEGSVECQECSGTGTIDKGSPVYYMFDLTTEATDRYQTTDKRGKPIKSSRYMKHFYGAHITMNVTCSLCDESIPVELDVEAQASSFEEA